VSLGGLSRVLSDSSVGISRVPLGDSDGASLFSTSSSRLGGGGGGFLDVLWWHS